MNQEILRNRYPLENIDPQKRTTVNYGQQRQTLLQPD